MVHSPSRCGLPLSMTAECLCFFLLAPLCLLSHMQLLASLAKHWLESAAGTARQQGGQHLGKARAVQQRGYNFLRQEVPSDPHGQVCKLLKASFYTWPHQVLPTETSTLCCRRSTCGTSMPGAMRRG